MRRRTLNLTVGAAALLLALPACQQTGDGPAASGARARSTARGRPLEPEPVSERLARLDLWITEWDVARAEGQGARADALATRIRGEVDAGFGEVSAAAAGRAGLRARYLGVSALAFASRPEATRLLLEALEAGDAELAGNALVALRLRADPDTPLEALVVLSQRLQPPPVRRYAPLALAAVLDARARAGAPAPPVALEQQALAGLAGLANDREAVVRLHAARALGALRGVDPTPPLVQLATDADMRVRWAAAAGLERRGTPHGFAPVVRLLHDTPQESKHIIRDLLVTYANRLQGRPLTSAEIDALGIGARAWTQWFTAWQAAAGPARAAR